MLDLVVASQPIYVVVLDAVAVVNLFFIRTNKGQPNSLDLEMSVTLYVQNACIMCPCLLLPSRVYYKVVGLSYSHSLESEALSDVTRRPALYIKYWPVEIYSLPTMLGDSVSAFACHVWS